MMKSFLGIAAICLSLSPLAGKAQEQTLSFDNGLLELPAVNINNKFFAVNFTVTETADGLDLQLADFSRLDSTVVTNSDEVSSFSGQTLSIPRLEIEGTVYLSEFRLTDLETISFSLVSTVAAGTGENQQPPPATCEITPDRSNGDDDPVIDRGWAADVRYVLDGGPGPDGIPPLELPNMDPPNFSSVPPWELVVGVKIGDEFRAYPHRILDYHEVVNDYLFFDGGEETFTLSYCPLTGSAMLWEGNMESSNSSFGTSGLLYNSNLIMYDRETRSYWSQMLEQAISGPALLSVPDKIQVVETTMQTWLNMYPQTLVMSEFTGFSRNYNVYPYGNYRDDQDLLFNVNNSDDDRLHRKERVVGITNRDEALAFPISTFGSSVKVINDTVSDMPVVVAGSSVDNFGVIYSRQLEDCTVLEFEPVPESLPIVMADNEGNEWDIFGVAQSGPRTGESLPKTNSYISYWFAWASFFPHTDIHQ
jgi:hypothetical protein